MGQTLGLRIGTVLVVGKLRLQIHRACAVVLRLVPIVLRRPLATAIVAFLALFFASPVSAQLTNHECGNELILTGSLATAGSQFALEVRGSVAYIASHDEGLVVVDISEPTAPALLNVIPLDSFVRAVHLSGDYLYVTQSTKVEIFNVSIPTQPIRVGPLREGNMLDVVVDGSTAYVIDIGEDLLHVLDVSSPSSPTLLTSEPIAEYGRVSAVVNNLLFVSLHADGLAIYSVADPSNPERLSATDFGPTVRDIAVSGSLVFLVDWSRELKIVEAADPRNPVIVGNTEFPIDVDTVDVYGDLVFVGSGWGIHIIDVFRPEAPHVVDTAYLPNGGFGMAVFNDGVLVTSRTSGLHFLQSMQPEIQARVRQSLVTGVGVVAAAVSGDTMFLGVTGPGRGITTADISDPLAPVILAHYDTVGSVEGLALAGDVLYAAQVQEGFQIYDVSDPTNLVPLGGVPLHRAWDVSVAGNVAYVKGPDNTLYSFDVTDPTNPVQLDSLASPHLHGQHVHAGRFLYVIDFSAGLQVIDISDPSAMELVTVFTPPDVGVRNPRSLALYGDVLYMDYGDLYAIDVSDPRAPAVLGSVPVLPRPTRTIVHGSPPYLAGNSYVDVGDPAAPRVMRHTGKFQFVNESVYAGNYLYVLDGGPPRLDTIQLSESLSEPIALGTAPTTGTALDLDIDGPIAYVAAGAGGLHVVDIADAANPVALAQLETPGTAYGVTVHGNTAYIADGTSGVLVVDVSDPAAPTALAVLETAQAAVRISIAGNLAYITDWTAGLQVADVSDPLNPTIIGTVDTPDRAQDIVWAGSMAYIADNSAGVQVVDISDPEDPRIAGAVDTPGGARALALAGDILYVADNDGGLQVVDITNPAAPQIIANAQTPGRALGVDVIGDALYVADVTNGLVHFDVSDPSAPVLMGVGPTAGFPIGVKIAGEMAYMANYTAGLQAVQISTRQLQGNPPIADAGPDQNVACALDSPPLVTLDGSRTTDDENDIASYTWSLGQTVLSVGPHASTQIPFTPGSYELTLTVEDACGLRSTDSMALTVEAPVNAPIAHAGPDIESNCARSGGDWVRLDSTGSSDADGDTLFYTWYEDGRVIVPESTSARPNEWFPIGVHEVRLEVRDSCGHKSSDTLTVTIGESAIPVPVAGPDIEAQCSLGGFATVTLDASGSSDADNDIVWYRWLQQGAVIAASQTPTAQVTLPGGLYDLSLEVEDSCGQRARDPMQLRVVGDGSLPVANAGPDRFVPCAGQSSVLVTLDGSLSTDASNDIVSYIWREDGAYVASSTEPLSTAFLTLGPHTLDLEVRDSCGFTSTDTVEILVGGYPPVAGLGQSSVLAEGCPGAAEGLVSLDASPSTDPDDDIVLYTWHYGFPRNETLVISSTEAVLENVSVPLIQNFIGPGFTLLYLTVEDSCGATSTSIVFVTWPTGVDTAPPIIEQPDELIVECTSQTGATVALTPPSVTDDCDPVPTLTNDAPAVFPFGETIVTWTSSDATGNIDSVEQRVYVVECDCGCGP